MAAAEGGHVSETYGGHSFGGSFVAIVDSCAFESSVSRTCSSHVLVLNGSSTPICAKISEI